MARPVPVAEQDIPEEASIALPGDAFDELLLSLDDPPTDGMAALLDTKPVWEG